MTKSALILPPIKNKNVAMGWGSVCAIAITVLSVIANPLVNFGEVT